MYDLVGETYDFLLKTGLLFNEEKIPPETYETDDDYEETDDDFEC